MIAAKEMRAKSLFGILATLLLALAATTRASRVGDFGIVKMVSFRLSTSIYILGRGSLTGHAPLGGGGAIIIIPSPAFPVSNRSIVHDECPPAQGAVVPICTIISSPYGA